MTPEERERLQTTLNATFGLVRATQSNTKAFRESVVSVLAAQNKQTQAVTNGLARAARASAPAFKLPTYPNAFAEAQRRTLENLRSLILSSIPDTSSLSETIARLKHNVEAQLPPNLRRLPAGSLTGVGVVIREDAIALYGVPRSEIVIELLEAHDRDARRMILGARAPEITHDCRTLMHSCAVDAARGKPPFVLDALESFDAGYTSSAQALAASIVDTLLRDFYGDRRTSYTPSHPKAPNPRTIEVLDTLPLREQLAVSPIWQTHQPFQPGEAGGIPGTFNRHATAHAVSPEQYTRINALEALLYCSALTYFIAQEEGRTVAAADPVSVSDRA